VIGQDRQVLHPFAKPRKGDRERIEPIEEVLSEFRALHRGLQIPVRRGDDANAHTPRRDVATGLISPAWSTRRSLPCISSGISPISSRKIVPPSAFSNRPTLSAMAPVNAPRDGEQFGFHQRGVSRRAIDGQEWLVAKGRVLVDGPSH